MGKGVDLITAGPTTTPSTGRVSVEGLEVTQAIQDMQHSVPLVAGKQTVVRVYLGRAAGASIKVRGELAVRRTANGPVQNIPSLDTAQVKSTQNGQLRTKREDVKLSLNFLLPDSLTTAGALFIRVSNVTRVSDGAAVPVDAHNALQVNLLDTPPLRVKLVLLRYRAGNPQVAHVPSARDLALTKSWLRRAYPVPQVISSQVTVDADAPWPFECDDANLQLSGIRGQDITAGADQRVHYYGLVSDGDDFMRGCANGIPSAPDPSAVASGPTGASSFGWDNDGSYADWYTAHELGHTFGRRHIGYCNQTTDDINNYPFTQGQLSNADGAFVGFDVGDTELGLPMQALPGVVWHDVMTYCQFQWLSSYTYSGIRQRIIAEDSLGAGPPAGGAAPPNLLADMVNAMDTANETPEFVHVVASVNMTQNYGRIAYVTPAARVTSVPQPEASEVSLVVKNSNGQTMGEYPAKVKLNTCHEEGEDEKGIVDADIPNLPDAAALDLVMNGQVLDTYRAGGEVAPVEDIHQAQGDANVAAGAAPPNAFGVDDDASANMVTFAWSGPAAAPPNALGAAPGAGGAGAAVNNITYTVQVSADGGETWQTVAVGRATPEATIDRSQFPGADALLVRVTATNGFQSSSTVQSFAADAL